VDVSCFGIYVGKITVIKSLTLFICIQLLAAMQFLWGKESDRFNIALCVLWNGKRLTKLKEMLSLYDNCDLKWHIETLVVLT
jgi:hypothetical protein